MRMPSCYSCVCIAMVYHELARDLIYGDIMLCESCLRAKIDVCLGISV